MQAEATKKKPKFILDEWANNAKGMVNESRKLRLNCVCESPENDKFIGCSRCGQKQHKCLQGRMVIRECLKCIARNLDPLYTVRKQLAETCFKTKDLEEYENLMEMIFIIEPEDAKFPVQVRGTQPGNKNLSWPMTGAFHINGEKMAFHEIRPLVLNSNRRSRKQEYFSIPKQKIVIGENVMTFRIPRLKKSYKDKYQFEREGVYFIGVYSIKKLTKEELIQKVINESRLEKDQSLKLLKKTDSQIVFEKEKINLMCPYTRSRIRVPVRGKNCPHFSCVCLETMIVTHETIRTWSCPMCKGDSRINEPKIDMWIYEILQDNLDYSEVIFSLDGTYQWVKPHHIINDLDDSDDDESFNRRIQQIAAKKEKKAPEKMYEKRIAEIVIDDDDDDDVPQQKQKKSISSNPKGPSARPNDALSPQHRKKQKKPKRPLNSTDKLAQQVASKDGKEMQGQLRSLFDKIQHKTDQTKLHRVNEWSEQQRSDRAIREDPEQQYIFRQPVIYDIIPLVFKEMTSSQFNSKYFKYQAKQRIPDNLKKIFRDIS